MLNLEIEQEVQLIESKTKGATCDLKRYNELHQPRMGEPVSALTSAERHEYFTLLTTMGVPEEDAAEAAKKLKFALIKEGIPAQLNSQNLQELRVKKTAIGAIKEVLQDFTNIVKTPTINSRTSSLNEAIPVHQEITVYRRK